MPIIVHMGFRFSLLRLIVSFQEADRFLDSVLPHELTHLIFRDFVGFKGEVPLWLDEGVAQWEEEVKRDWIKRGLREHLGKRTLLSLKYMMDLDIRLIKDTDTVYFHANTIDDKPGFIVIDGRNLIELFYLQSASLVGFLIEVYGSDSFTDFCRQLRDGKTLEKALRLAYPNSLNSLAELEKGWLKYLREE